MSSSAIKNRTKKQLLKYVMNRALSAQDIQLWSCTQRVLYIADRLNQPSWGVAAYLQGLLREKGYGFAGEKQKKLLFPLQSEGSRIWDLEVCEVFVISEKGQQMCAQGLSIRRYFGSLIVPVILPQSHRDHRDFLFFLCALCGSVAKNIFPSQHDFTGTIKEPIFSQLWEECMA